jgi:hypothetical protein
MVFGLLGGRDIIQCSFSWRIHNSFNNSRLAINQLQPFFFWNNGLVKIEVGFLIIVGAFGESLFECPKSNPKGHASLNAPQGKRRPAHNNHNY